MTKTLPKIKNPIFELELPSTGEKIKYRTFTVKEEKILLIAQETKDVEQAILSIKQVVNNCLIDKKIEDLSMFDLEYILITLRSKSVDNAVAFSIKDPETEEKIEAGTKREIEEKIEADKTLQKFRHWYEEKIFFRTILDNAQREMARTHLPTSRLYIGQDSVGDPFHRLLINEFGKTREAVLQITGQKELLDNRKVIKDSIHFRNHFTYPLNVIQADLLKRWSQAPSEQEKKMLRDLIFLSINSVAAAMQSTG